MSFPEIDWATDVLPTIQSLMGNGLVTGSIIAVGALSIVVLGARGLISIFWKRE